MASSPASSPADMLQAAIRHHRAGRLDEAEAQYRQVLTAQPENSDALHLLGVIAHQRARYQEAVETIRRAIALKPNAAEYHNNCGEACRAMNQTDEAIACYQRAVALHPGFALAHNNLGMTYQAQGKLDRARQCYEMVIAAEPGRPEAYYNLGLVLQALGRWEAAAENYRTAIRLKPDLGAAYNSLALALKKLGRLEEAIEHHELALRIEPGSAEFHFDLGMTLSKIRKFTEAAVHLRETLRLEPGRLEASYLLAALGDAPTPATAPPEYVGKLFDEYAANFDHHLVNKLDYHIPEETRRAIRDLLGPGAGTLDILDLGCGTGLCGPLFRDLARTLTGVDLSEKMLEKARARNVYDSLRHADITEVMRESTAAYDLIIAADVFVYVGDLTAVFAACRQALRPNGLFAFSVEAAAEDATYVLRDTGRYAHSLNYLRRLAQTEGLGERWMEPRMLRKDKGAPIAGNIFVLKKPGEDQTSWDA